MGARALDAGLPPSLRCTCPCSAAGASRWLHSCGRGRRRRTGARPTLTRCAPLAALRHPAPAPVQTRACQQKPQVAYAYTLALAHQIVSAPPSDPRPRQGEDLHQLQRARAAKSASPHGTARARPRLAPTASPARSGPAETAGGVFRRPRDRARPPAHSERGRGATGGSDTRVCRMHRPRPLIEATLCDWAPADY